MILIRYVWSEWLKDEYYYFLLIQTRFNVCDICLRDDASICIHLIQTPAPGVIDFVMVMDISTKKIILCIKAQEENTF